MQRRETSEPGEQDRPQRVRRPVEWPRFEVAYPGGRITISLEDDERDFPDPGEQLTATFAALTKGSELPHALVARGKFSVNQIDYEFTYPLGFDGEVWRLHRRAFRPNHGRLSKGDLWRTDYRDVSSARAGVRAFEEEVVPALEEWVRDHQDEVRQAEALRRTYRIATIEETIHKEDDRHARAQATRWAAIETLRGPVEVTVVPLPPWTVEVEKEVALDDVVKVDHSRPGRLDGPKIQRPVDTVHLQRTRTKGGKAKETAAVVVTGVTPGDLITMRVMPTTQHELWAKLMPAYEQAVKAWSGRHTATEKREKVHEPFPDPPADLPDWHISRWIVDDGGRVLRLSDNDKFSETFGMYMIGRAALDAMLVHTEGEDGRRRRDPL